MKSPTTFACVIFTSGRAMTTAAQIMFANPKVPVRCQMPDVEKNFGSAYMGLG
jgi:hypothetical protein